MTNTEEKYTNSSHNFNYNGDIKIKIMDGNRIYSEKHYHNAGCRTLFNFFVDCLVGNYNIAKSSRPCRIVLFKADKKDTQDATYPHPNWSEETRVSSKIYYDSTAFPAKTDGSGSVTFHFRIPFIALNPGERVTKLGLYPDQISNFESDLCAEYRISQDADDSKDPDKYLFEIPINNSNYTVIIDWTLTITNQEKTNTNN